MDIRAYYGGKSPETMQGAMESVLGCLRAQYWLYQTAHWQVRGTGFYGDHELFQRLYEGVQAEVDVLAEKLVGYFGSEAVDAVAALGIMQAEVQGWAAGTQCPYRRALRAEQQFQALLKAAYEMMKADADLPLGLDDWLMATASSHETHIYLLQQRLRTAAVESGAAAPSAEGEFFDNPEKREVRELAESEAVTNDPGVAEKAEEEGEEDASVAAAEDAPPTPTEVAEEPGGAEFSTLNRFVVQTEEPVRGVPEGHGDVDKHPDIKSASDALAQTYWKRH